MVKYNWGGRVGRTVQILGWVILSACLSAQSLASSDPRCKSIGHRHYECDLGPVRADDLIIKKDSGEIINALFYLNTQHLTDYLYGAYKAIIDVTHSPELKDLMSGDVVYFNNGKSFKLGDWSVHFSPYVDPIRVPTDFSIPFSKTKLMNWLGGSKEKELSLYANIRAYKYDFGRVSSDREDWYSYVTIPIKLQDYAYISGLEDLNLNEQDHQSFCVSSTTGTASAPGQITLAVESTNGFHLVPKSSAKSLEIGYTMKLEGKNCGADQEIVLTQPESRLERWDAHHAEFADTDVDCLSKGDNMKLFINMDSTAANAQTGIYTDTVTIIVAPAS